jgi:hypothetical protein
MARNGAKIDAYLDGGQIMRWEADVYLCETARVGRCLGDEQVRKQQAE